MKKFLTCAIGIFFAGSLQAQQLAKNTIYLEAGGAALLGSLNYERLIGLKENNYLDLRGGLLYINTFSGGQRIFWSIPVGASYIIQGKRLCFETGLTFAAVSDKYRPSHFPPDDYSIDYLTGFRVGIRRQPVRSGIFWNAAVQATWYIIRDMNYPEYGMSRYTTGMHPWLSLGLGYAF